MQVRSASPHFRVFVDATSLYSGGAQTHLRNLLRQSGLPAITLLITRSMFLKLGLEDLADPVFAPEAVRSPLARVVWRASRLRGLLKESRADVYFDPAGTSAPRLPVPFVTIVRNMLPFDPRIGEWYGWSPHGAVYLRLQRRKIMEAVKRADGVIFTSEWSKQRICSLLDQEPRRSMTIPHGLEAGAAYEQSEAGPPGILYVSDFHPYKRHRELVLAYGLCRDRGVRLGKLTLVGKPGYAPYGRQLRRFVDSTPWRDSVSLPGWLSGESLRRAYRSAGIIAVPSSVECCPNVVLEALASGKPLLCSNEPPMPEFAGDAAVYADPSDPEALARGIVALVDMTDARRQVLRAAALQRAGRHDWRMTAAQTWAFLRQMVQLNPLAAES